jgi:hypothetical protein
MVRKYPLANVALFIYFTSALHFSWAICLLLWGDQIYSTSLSFFLAILYPWQVALMLLVTSVLAMSGERIIRTNTIQGVLYFLPQQIILSISGGSGIVAALAGEYPDGTIKSSGFIFTDQDIHILTLIFHTIAIFLVVISTLSSRREENVE